MKMTMAMLLVAGLVGSCAQRFPLPGGGTGRAELGWHDFGSADNLPSNAEAVPVVIFSREVTPEEEAEARAAPVSAP